MRPPLPVRAYPGLTAIILNLLGLAAAVYCLLTFGIWIALLCYALAAGLCAVVIYWIVSDMDR